MTNPVFVDCPKGEWTKVATNVTTGQLHKWGIDRLEYLITYRLTGASAPTNKAEGTQIFLGHIIDEPISAIVNSDIYLYVVLGDGRVRVDLNDDPVGKNIIITNPETGDSVSTIPTNGYTGIVALAPGHVSTASSTATLLIADEKFTGEWEDITNFGVIVVSLSADESSAIDGLLVQFSADGTEAGIISADEFTYTANAKKTFSFQTATKYFRVSYTNGGSPQNAFILQTILKPYYVKPSSHRIQDLIIDDDDAELIKAVITGKKADGNYDNVSLTNGANMKVSLEELESGISSNSNSQLNITPFASGGGEYKQDLKTGAFTTISYPHHEIHSGSHFFTGNYTTLGNGASYDILFVTPNTLEYAHMIFELATEAEAMFNYYEATIASANGTPLTMFDRNRTTDNTPSVTFYHTPTVTNVGTELGAGIFGSGKSQGGSLRDSNEIIMKPNTKYLMRVTNNTVSANWYDWQFDWYEHTDK